MEAGDVYLGWLGGVLDVEVVVALQINLVLFPGLGYGIVAGFEGGVEYLEARETLLHLVALLEGLRELLGNSLVFGLVYIPSLRFLLLNKVHQIGCARIVK